MGPISYRISWETQGPLKGGVVSNVDTKEVIGGDADDDSGPRLPFGIGGSTSVRPGMLVLLSLLAAASVHPPTVFR